jgi:hypothetical protein
MIEVTSTGDFKKTEAFLYTMKKGDIFSILERYGQQGVDALASATPINTGETAASWYYEVKKEKGKYSIIWHNSNVPSGIPVAILIQYGHATRNGGWIEGLDYINPSIHPLFEKITNDVWERVKHG